MRVSSTASGRLTCRLSSASVGWPAGPCGIPAHSASRTRDFTGCHVFPSKGLISYSCRSRTRGLILAVLGRADDHHHRHNQRERDPIRHLMLLHLNRLQIPIRVVLGRMRHPEPVITSFVQVDSVPIMRNLPLFSLLST